MTSPEKIEQNMETFTKSLAGLSFGYGQASDHSGLYKQKQTRSSIDVRRAAFLANQKRKRFDYVNLVRQLTESDWYGDADYMDYRSGYYANQRHEFNKDQLMFSEWMTEVPIDFESEWLCVPCPVGKRCLLVASRGKTSAWSKAANHLATFPSNFPGGGPYNFRDCTILDCLYNQNANTFFILDLMCWRGQTLYESETEFRFYWLHTKIQENPDILKTSKNNPYNFVPLTSCPCSREAIYDALDKPVFSVHMDGVMFYHRRTHYTFGATPLVGWLKPFMLPEIMDVDLPDSVKALRPPSYVDYATYMRNFDESRRSWMSSRGGGMFRMQGAFGGGRRNAPWPQEREIYVPQDATPRTQKKNKKKKKKRNSSSTSSMDTSLEVPGLNDDDNDDDDGGVMEEEGGGDSSSRQIDVVLKPSSISTAAVIEAIGDSGAAAGDVSTAVDDSKNESENEKSPLGEEVAMIETAEITTRESGGDGFECDCGGVIEAVVNTVLREESSEELDERIDTNAASHDKT